MGWNRDRNNSRVIRVQDKGSSFVVDWTTNYFERCDEYVGDTTTFRSDGRDLSAEHAVEDKRWAEKWESNEVLSSEEASWVRIDNLRPARLYANIKTHKNGWPFRFILSARESAIENLARWVECQLKVIATKTKAYINDTKSFLLYLEDLNKEKAPFPPHARMISWDIVNFYPNCDRGLCLQAVRRALDRWEPKMSEERKRCICEAVSITMNFGNGELETNFFTQINGATIRGPGSPSITDIFRAEFIDPITQNGFKPNAGGVIEPESWGRYRDDTFNIEVGELSSIENVDRFTKHINENVLQNKIRFEEKTSNSELEFLDVKECLKDGYLMPRIYAKPTDAHRYLDPSSCHPKKVTRAIPLSVILRLRRNCSDKYENDRVFMEGLKEYKGYLLDCASEEDYVNKSFFKAFKTKMCKALEGKRYVRDKQPKINFVTAFDPSFPDIGGILKKHAHILWEDEQCNILFPDKCFRVVHRRGHQNLKEWVASSRIKDQRSEGRVGHEEEDPGCRKCGNCEKKTQGRKRACGIYNCQVMEEGDSFASKVTGEGTKLGKLSTVKVKI